MVLISLLMTDNHKKKHLANGQSRPRGESPVVPKPTGAEKARTSTPSTKSPAVLPRPPISIALRPSSQKPSIDSGSSGSSGIPVAPPPSRSGSKKPAPIEIGQGNRSATASSNAPITVDRDNEHFANKKEYGDADDSIIAFGLIHSLSQRSRRWVKSPEKWNKIKSVILRPFRSGIKWVNLLNTWNSIIKSTATLFGRRLLSKRAEQYLLNKGLSAKLIELLGRARMLHVSAVVAGLAILSLVMAILLKSPSEQAKPLELPGESIGVTAGETVVESTGETTKENHRTVVEQSPSGLAASDDSVLEPEAQAKLERGRGFDTYPSFPWKKHIDRLLSKLKTSQLSDLFGASKDTVAGSLDKLASFGPTGYDLLANAQTIDFYPHTPPAHRAPRLTFFFESDKLFEIKLAYETDPAIVVEEDLFGPLFGVEAAKYDSHQGRAVIQYEDCDVTIEQIRREDVFGRVFRSFRFLDNKIATAKKEVFLKRQKAENLFDEGMDLFSQSKFKGAIDKFRRARRIIPEYGQASVMEAIALLRREMFSKADRLADATLAQSRDKRARANANGIKGITSLYSGNKPLALSFFDAAVNLDNTNPLLNQSRQELETGQYSLESVTKTAARMKCLKKSTKTKQNRFTQAGILARGNFPNKATFKRALKTARLDPDFKSKKYKWWSWECK